MNTVKLAIAELRKGNGITQSDLADYLGVSFQAVSKWENGTSMPDITLLPMLAEYFKVSVDQILGLKPLNDKEYIPRGFDTAEKWHKKMECLKDSRVGFWNEDYLEFLVAKVWKITQPISIVDFGCRDGHLGQLLLPILPKGSSYTGVDISERLIEEAKSTFEGSEFKTEFIRSDLGAYDVNGKYDMAICQALLRHMPNPKEILQKMVDAVCIGGRVICIEVNREFEHAGLHIKGIDYNSFGTTAVFQKFWKAELASEGRDYSIGMKMPFYMDECGLQDIDVRINDRVNFINPNGDKNQYEKQLGSLMRTNGWNKDLSEDEKEKIIKLFMSRGLTRAEAEKYVKSNAEISHYLMDNKDCAFVLKTLGVLISYGTKAE